jgi:hypothetical protein
VNRASMFDRRRSPSDCRLLERHPNLYLNLETTFAYILTKPRVFAKVLGTLLTRCGSERLMFATGKN